MMLNIGYLSTFYHTSILMMAREKVIENRAGIKTDWKLFANGPAIVDAFRRREINLAYLGLPPAIIGINKGAAIVCVAGGHVEGTVLCGSMQYQGFPALYGLGEILKQFIGQKIGVPGKGSIHDVILMECLHRLHLDKDIKVVNFQWADTIIDAMAKGEVSAAMGTPALAVAIAHYALGKILFPPSKIWPNNPSYGIIADKNYLKNERELVEKFLTAHEEATAFMRNNPEDAARVISDYVKLVDREYVLEILKMSPKYCAQISDEYVSSTMEFVRALKKLGYIDREMAKNEIFDTSLIKKIHPSKDHYRDGISAPV